MFKHLRNQKFTKTLLNFDNKELNTQIKGNFRNNLFKTPKRFQSQMNNPFNSLPIVTKRIVIANCLIFGLGLFMNSRQYITEFFYHKYALQHNKFHVLLTTHFAKANLFDFLIDTFITGLLGSQVENMLGMVTFQKLVMGSMALGSILMIGMVKDDAFYKSEAILRGLIYYFVFSNPQQQFYLFPLPIQIKVMYVGVFIAVMDYLSGRWGNFGGLLAALLLTRRLF